MPLCPNCRRNFETPPGATVPLRCEHCGSKVLGRCCDLDWIGGGAMGDVYKGRQPDMGNRLVAIKIPKQADARMGQRFEREIAAAARLKHEHIVCAYDRGEEAGHPYLVMEFVAGRILSDVVEAEHPLSPRRVARIARGIAHA
jgi:serine/threonine protein kinase